MFKIISNAEGWDNLFIADGAPSQVVKFWPDEKSLSDGACKWSVDGASGVVVEVLASRQYDSKSRIYLVLCIYKDSATAFAVAPFIKTYISTTARQYLRWRWPRGSKEMDVFIERCREIATIAASAPRAPSDRRGTLGLLKLTILVLLAGVTGGMCFHGEGDSAPTLQKLRAELATDEEFTKNVWDRLLTGSRFAEQVSKIYSNDPYPVPPPDRWILTLFQEPKFIDGLEGAISRALMKPWLHILVAECECRK